MTSATSTAATKTGARHAKEQRAAATTRGVTTLMYAAQQGDVDRVRKIVKNQPTSLYNKDRTGKTPLHYCTTSDSKRAAQAADILVMAAPDLVETHDEDGFTPLHLAVIAGNMPLVTFLLANNADINAVDNEKHTVVHWATVCGETGALRAVLAAGAPVSTPDVHGGYPLHYAAQMCGGERDSQLGFQVLQTLLTHGEIVVTVEDGDGRQPLLWASSAGSAKAVLALIRAGSAVEASDKDGLTALHCAASRGHTDCIDSLLTLCGASPDVIDSNGCTALHYAVTLGHADATALLLAHGADPNRQDRKGRSPAHCGCAKGQFETVKMIGAHGANLWLRNARGDLPLHEASASGRRDLVKWLLELRPSQVNARNNDGRCPLHLAALNDNSDMCKILLDAGAQVNPILRTSKNAFMTPLDCALQRGFRSTAKYLQLHGGVPASRLGDSRHQKPDSGLNLHIRDDLTFWGDTSSDSERENGETKLEKKIQQRKKLAHKFEKKRLSLSGSDPESAKLLGGKLESAKAKRRLLEQRNQKVRAGARSDSAISIIDYPSHGSRNANKSGRIDYTNEIIINGKTEINIHQSNEYTIGKDVEIATERSVSKTIGVETEDGAKVKSSATSIKDGKRPKSSKSVRSGKDKSQKPVKVDSAKIKSGKVTPKSGKSAEEVGISEEMVEHLENKKIEIGEKEEIATEAIDKLEDNTIDQHSLISNTSEDVEGNAQTVVVEAAVHEPPKQKSDEKEADSADQGKAEVLKTEPAEEEVTKTISESTIIENRNENKEITETVTTETKTVTETITTTKEIKSEDVKTGTISQDDQTTTAKEDDMASQFDAAEVIKSEEIVKESEKVDEQVSSRVKEDELDLVPQKEGSAKQRVKESEKTEPETEQKAEESPTRKLEESPQREDSKQQTSEALNEEGKTGTEEEQVRGKEAITKQKHVAICEEQNSTKQRSQTTEDTLSVTSGSLISTTDKTKESKSKRKQRKHRKKWEKPEKAYEIIDKTFPDDDKDHKTTTESEKASKKEESVRFKDKPEESSRKSSDDEDNSSELITDEGTSSSSNQEHKSFRVLDESEQLVKAKKDELNKHKSRTLKKQRSKSEENKKSQTSNERGQKLKRSKIPTPLSRSRLSKSDKHLDARSGTDGRKVKSSMDSSKVPSLPNIHDPSGNNKSRSRDTDHTRSGSNMSAPLLAYSDAEGRGSGSDLEEDHEERSATRRKKVKRKTRSSRGARSAGSDYESSNVIDSGFEPSPRSSRIPKWRNMTERGVNMDSVTQTIQTNIRRYHLERKIFQHLLDLKRLQIRSGQHNEAMLVKRAIDSYHQSCASTVGAGRYVPEDLTFKSFEKFLYLSLRKIQRNNEAAEYLKGLPEAPNNPLLCTQSTHRCMHATHAYTGIPCAAYLPKMDYHSIPKIGFGQGTCKPGTAGGFLPSINAQKKSVTLELSHGNDRQIISLPADRLDQNKRYYVTFTVKGDTPTNPSLDSGGVMGHQHPKSD